MKRSLSKSQIACLSLLWLALCYMVIVRSPKLDGPTIMMLIISGLLVFVPVFKMLKKKR